MLYIRYFSESTLFQIPAKLEKGKKCSKNIRPKKFYFLNEIRKAELKLIVKYIFFQKKSK